MTPATLKTHVPSSFHTGRIQLWWLKYHQTLPLHENETTETGIKNKSGHKHLSNAEIIWEVSPTSNGYYSWQGYRSDSYPAGCRPVLFCEQFRGRDKGENFVGSFVKKKHICGMMLAQNGVWGMYDVRKEASSCFCKKNTQMVKLTVISTICWPGFTGVVLVCFCFPVKDAGKSSVGETYDHFWTRHTSDRPKLSTWIFAFSISEFRRLAVPIW